MSAHQKVLCYYAMSIIHSTDISFMYSSTMYPVLEIGTLVHYWWDCKMVQPLWKTVWWFFKN